MRARARPYPLVRRARDARAAACRLPTGLAWTCFACRRTVAGVGRGPLLVAPIQPRLVLGKRNSNYGYRGALRNIPRSQGQQFGRVRRELNQIAC